MWMSCCVASELSLLVITRSSSLCSFLRGEFLDQHENSWDRDKAVSHLLGLGTMHNAVDGDTVLLLLRLFGNSFTYTYTHSYWTWEKHTFTLAVLQNGFTAKELNQFLNINWFCQVSSKHQVQKSNHRISSSFSSLKKTSLSEDNISISQILWCVSSVVICQTGKVTEQVSFYFLKQSWINKVGEIISRVGCF